MDAGLDAHLLCIVKFFAMEQPINPHEARTTLDDITGLRRRTREARQAFWFPLIVFAVLILNSAPLYVATGTDGTETGDRFGFLGGMGTSNAEHIAVFWIIAMPLGYAITAGYYLWHARRRGVATSWQPYVGTGIVLFALIAFLLASIAPRVASKFVEVGGGDLAMRGLTPLLIIAVGFVVLARIERSLVFGVFSVAFLALTVAANLYDMSNITARLGFGAGGPDVNNLVVGNVLLAAGLYFAVRAHGFTMRVRPAAEQHPS
jgi:hypothetical protein